MWNKFLLINESMRMKYVYLILFACVSFMLRAAGDLDVYMAKKGMTDVHQLDSTIRFDLMYARPDNFLKKAVYTGITQIWLRPEAARMLVNAQRQLKKEYPGYSLIVYDAARPMAVQQKMWSLVRGTNQSRYVSNPGNGGGLHNYGMAVDVSIVDEKGEPLPMGTPVDFFGKEAHINDEQNLLKTGLITKEAYENRQLLRRIMRNAGFHTILYEWWHFNACSRETARKLYPVL